MMYLRACFRCGGDVFLDRDTYGAFFKCLQCGFSRDVPSRDERTQMAVAMAEPDAVVPDGNLDAEAA
ncbi:MAG: hypothetical protein Q7R41_00010 [Phycisphaerales bacterium]|nr:hypothetical protein [Phycisphaerales bacterium]